MSQLTWVLESGVFPDSHPPLRDAIRRAGHHHTNWNDDWWNDGIPQGLGDGATVFHGSLGNASAINKRLRWTPGSFCHAPSFHCSAWYESARPWLVHTDWRVIPADEFVASVESVASDLGCSDLVFVRPDSPLKPFSGRVLRTDSVTLASLDYGFYYDDARLPIVVAPARDIGREWRFVVVRSTIVAGSAYDAESRSAVSASPNSAAWAFAISVSRRLPAPSEVYVLDVCESDGDLRLLELNPFGGADLYACDPPSVVEAIAEISQAV